MLRLVVFLAAVLAVRAQTTAVSSCSHHTGQLPLNVYVENCTTPPCLLPQLQDAVLNITFRAPQALDQMTTLATVSFGGLPIPIPYDLGTNAVTCNFLQNTDCPVPEDKVIEYQLRMFVESYFPLGALANIEISIVDSSDNSAIMCFRVPTRIEPPAQVAARSDATLGGL